MYNEGLSIEDNFDVKESAWLNWMFSGIFFLLFTLAFFISEPINSKDRGIYNKLLFMSIIPAVLFGKKARSKNVAIRINKQGIYHYNEFITNWDNYLDGYIDENPDKSARSISDDYVLMI